MRDKKKKTTKVRDLKPRKDAKGGYIGETEKGPTRVQGAHRIQSPGRTQ